MVKDDYPSMHQNKVWSMIIIPACTRTSLTDGSVYMKEVGGDSVKKLTLLSVCLLHNPQSTIQRQQATSPQSQCTMPNITSFGTRSCNMLSFKNTPSVPIFGKFLWPILYIWSSDNIVAKLCQYLYSGAALFKLICLDSTTKSVLYLKYPSMNPLDFVAEKVHTC